MSITLTARERRMSDLTSGLDLKRENFPTISDDDVARNFELFKHYDLDNTGFISPDNMFEVLKALDMDVSMESVHGMIQEVAILTGHDNDGKLSFRDFMNMQFHDMQAADSPSVEGESTAAASAPEIEEPESPVGAPANAAQAAPVNEIESTPASEPEAELPSESKAKGWAFLAESQAPPPMMKRKSSMSALNALAAGRIKAFQQVATDMAEREKLNKFKKAPVVVTGPMVNSDNMHLETLQSKLKAFEIAAHYQGKIELRKTWKKVGAAGNYQSGHKILLGGQPAGFAPKKKLTDLP